MDNDETGANTNEMEMKRRPSMLKRRPSDETIADVFSSTGKASKRVSFASINFVKPFAADPEKTTIWDSTYEEVVNHDDSTKSCDIIEPDQPEPAFQIWESPSISSPQDKIFRINETCIEFTCDFSSDIKIGQNSSVDRTRNKTVLMMEDMDLTLGPNHFEMVTDESEDSPSPPAESKTLCSIIRTQRAIDPIQHESMEFTTNQIDATNFTNHTDAEMELTKNVTTFLKEPFGEEKECTDGDKFAQDTSKESCGDFDMTLTTNLALIKPEPHGIDGGFKLFSKPEQLPMEYDKNFIPILDNCDVGGNILHSEPREKLPMERNRNSIPISENCGDVGNILHSETVKLPIERVKNLISVLDNCDDGDNFLNSEPGKLPMDRDKKFIPILNNCDGDNVLHSEPREKLPIEHSRKSIPISENCDDVGNILHSETVKLPIERVENLIPVLDNCDGDNFLNSEPGKLPMDRDKKIIPILNNCNVAKLPIERNRNSIPISENCDDVGNILHSASKKLPMERVKNSIPMLDNCDDGDNFLHSGPGKLPIERDKKIIPTLDNCDDGGNILHSGPREKMPMERKNNFIPILENCDDVGNILHSASKKLPMERVKNSIPMLDNCDDGDNFLHSGPGKLPIERDKKIIPTLDNCDDDGNIVHSEPREKMPMERKKKFIPILDDFDDDGNILQSEPEKLPIKCVKNFIPILENFAVTPTTSFAMNLCNMSPSVEDTQQLIHATFSKPESIDKLLKVREFQQELKPCSITAPTDNASTKSKTSPSSSPIEAYLVKNNISIWDLVDDNIKIVETDDDSIAVAEEPTPKKAASPAYNTTDFSNYTMRSQLILRQINRVLVHSEDNSSSSSEEERDERCAAACRRLAEVTKRLNDFVENYGVPRMPSLDLEKFFQEELEEESISCEAIQEDSEDGQCSRLSMRDLEMPKTLDERVRHAAEGSKKYWRFLKFENEHYHFETLFKAIYFKVHVHPDMGIVYSIETRNQIKEVSAPVAHYGAKFVELKLNWEHLLSALGPKFDLLALLDYICVCIDDVVAFHKEFDELEVKYGNSHKLRMERDGRVIFEILSCRFLLYWVITMEMSLTKLGCVENVSARHETRKTVDEKEIKRMAENCPQNIHFLRCFIDSVNEYVERIGERIVSRKESKPNRIWEMLS